jgi:hypothetical protein
MHPLDQLGDAHAKGPRVGQHAAHVADSGLGPGAEPLAESSDQASAGAHKCLKADAMPAPFDVLRIQIVQPADFARLGQSRSSR